MIARIYKLNENDEREAILYEKEVFTKSEIESVKKLKEMLEKETKSKKYVATTIFEEVNDKENNEWEIK